VTVLLAALLAQPSFGTTRYLLLTTQRSGSTWFCSVLNRQPGIACGADKRPNPSKSSRIEDHVVEMMINYSFMKRRAVVVDGYMYTHSNITWAVWRKDCEAQFATLAHGSSRETTAIGFKLMYDQVPPRLRSDFVQYVTENEIKLLHLERQAVLLQVASGRYQSKRNQLHEWDPMRAAQSRCSTPRLHVPFSEIEPQLRQSIEEHRWWKSRLRYAPGVSYEHVTYEELIGPAAESHLRSVVAFLADPGEEGVVLRSTKLESDLNLLHQSSCQARIAPELYAKVRASFGEDSDLVRACTMLDALDKSDKEPCPSHNSLPNSTKDKP